ncbi:uncharacterized protein LOC143035962 isoform X2 [Oratosquilla oratoria]|uniref:uncharacterized protein LOC143035962 isoform X2 n=1 Tax=Oratosquilla oratoria TaxID=337810 RepID=UPI003F777AE8
MATSDEDIIPVRDGRAVHPVHIAPEQMYWLSRMEPEELREKYVGLQDDFFTLKKFSIKQEDKIKKLQTKVKRVISDRERETPKKGYDLGKHEARETIESQKSLIQQMTIRNEQLEKKVKLANIQLTEAQRNKPLLFRHVGPRVDSGLKQGRKLSVSTPPSRRRNHLPPRPHSTPPKPPQEDQEDSVLETPETLKKYENPSQEMLPERVRKVLEEARERILSLESDRDELQEQLAEIQTRSEETTYEWQQKVANLEEELTHLQGNVRERDVREERDSVALVRAQREVRTLTSQVTALQQHLTTAEEQVASYKIKRDTYENDIDNATKKLHTAEQELRELQQEARSLKLQLREEKESYQVLKREVEQLQKENEKLTSLSLASEQHQEGRTNQVEQLTKQVKQLEAALQTDLEERGALLERLGADKEELAKQEIEIKEFQTKCLGLQEELESANQKLEIFTKASSFDMADLQEAMEILKEKRRGTYRPTLSEKELQDEIIKLKSRYADLQMVYREKSLELKETSILLSKHNQTYKGLEAELRQTHNEAAEKEKKLEETIKTLQETIQRRDSRQDKLEKQLLSVTDKSMREKIESMNTSGELSQTLKLGRHDNILEFHISKVTYHSDEFEKLKTFLSWTVPFALEDPLQHTNVMVGTQASYNHSALYKIQMNHENLESLREDIVTVSAYILLESGHPVKVGVGSLVLGEVLQHPRNTLHGTLDLTRTHDLEDQVDIISIKEKESIGTLAFWFRLQRPCEEEINRYLRSVGMLVEATRGQGVVPQQATDMLKSLGVINPRQAQHHQVKPKTTRKEKTPKNRVSSSNDLSAQDLPESSKEDNESEVKTDLDEKEEDRESSMGDDQAHTSPKHREVAEDSTPTKGKVKGSAKGGKESNEEHSPMPETSKTRRAQRVGSASSTKTFKVSSSSTSQSETDSPVHQTHEEEEIPTRESKKRVKSSVPKRQSSGRSKVQLVRPASAAPPKPPRSFTYNSSEETSTSSKQDNLHTEKTKTPDLPAAEEEQSEQEESDSDTMFEESNASDTDMKLVTVLGIKETEATGAEDTSEETSSLDQDSRSQKSLMRRIKNECSVSSPSPSSQTITSDSEGVVAQVHKSSKNKKDKIYVEICSLSFHPRAKVTKDRSVSLVFVDYHGFLGLPPQQLETPMSLPKPKKGQKVFFNFGQELKVYEGSRTRAALEKLMAQEQAVIRFTITSEPPPHLQDSHDCMDIGYTFVDLHDLVARQTDMEEEELAIKDADGKTIGVLVVSVRAIQVLSQLQR